MKTLTLSGNTCGVEACKAIGAALSTKPTLKVKKKIMSILNDHPFSPYLESYMERYFYW